MSKRTRTLLIIFFLLIVVPTICYGLFINSYMLKLSGENYYLPEYRVETRNDTFQSHVIVTAAFDRPFSLDRFYNQHWWIGVVGIDITLESEEITNLEVRLNFDGKENIFIPKYFSANYNGDSITDLHVIADDSQEFELFFKRIDFSKTAFNQ